MKSEIKHPFPPLYNEYSKVLILGSFPSVKSRENSFFYGHPQNRFWKVMAAVLNEDVPKTVEDKKHMLLCHNIALWDSIASCEIEGSSDASISKVVANDLGPVLEKSRIKAIFCNGQKAYELYRKHIEPSSGINAVCLPSTSPANASWSIDELITAYKDAILTFL